MIVAARRSLRIDARPAMLVSQLESNPMAVSLRLPEDLSKRLTRLAEQTGRSKTYYILEAVREHIDDFEDIYLAEQRLEKSRLGKSKSIPLEDVMKRYGL